MLRWFLDRHRRTSQPQAAEASGAAARVRTTDDHIEMIEVDGATAAITWDSLMRVDIVTTLDGPAAPDLFWLLQPRSKGPIVVVPMGTAGENDMLHALQKRLAGFDNMTVIEAMGSSEAASFIIWREGGQTSSD